MRITESEFSCSFSSYNDLFNPSKPEFAFAGKSNVGKSSLINTLLNRKRLAYISKKPGKTRLLNYFLVNKKFFFVDLPGYGFARVSAKIKQEWKNFIEEYFYKSKNLKMLFILVDIRRGLTKQDLELIEFCNYNSIIFTVIFTKADKLSKNKQIQARNSINKNSLKTIGSEPILFSTKTKLGKNEVLNILDYYLRGEKK